MIHRVIRRVYVEQGTAPIDSSVIEAALPDVFRQVDEARVLSDDLFSIAHSPGCPSFPSSTFPQ
jgi:hypothetical protein